jgi:hypothetical protein
VKPEDGNRKGAKAMSWQGLAYDELPQLIKDNLSEQQWLAAQRDLIDEGQAVPETARYIDIKSGQIKQHTAGETARGSLLPVHDLSGGGGADDTQFHTTPPGARGRRQS